MSDQPNSKTPTKKTAARRGRPRTGAIRRTPDGRLQPIVTFSSGQQKRLPPLPHGTSEARAREIAAHYSEKAASLPIHAKEPKPALARIEAREAERWVETWFQDREARGLTSVRENRSHWSVHIEATFGGKHPRDWTRDDLRALSTVLDAKVRDGLHWKTATNVWGTVTRMCDDAMSHKRPEIRCRDDNPALGVRGPDRGDTKAREFLYPSEFLELVCCSDVPVAFRRLAAIAIYTFLRSGELQALRWEDVNLDNRTIHVHRSRERKTGRTKHTKGRAARRIPIHANLAPVLEVMKAESGGTGLVFALADEQHLASALRKYLGLAKVQRTSIFEAEATRRRLVFHDLRGTGITWHAVAGTEPLRIQQWAGHTDFQTTQGYLATADAIGRDGFGTPFPALPKELFSGDSFLPSANSRMISVDAAGFEPATPAV